MSSGRADTARPLSEEERYAQALGWALAQVNRRERTVAEVRSHLDAKDVPEARAEAVVEELVAAGLVDDERFAAMFVADKRTLESWGIGRIRRGLIARGVDLELAARALAASDAHTASGADVRSGAGSSGVGGWSDRAALRDAELTRALELLRRRFPVPPADGRARERALGVLLRKGYDSELALDALRAHVAGD